MKFNSPDFFLPFAQSVNRPLCHVNGKKPLFLVSLVNEVTLTSPAFKKSLSGIRCPKVMLHGTIFRTTERCNVGTYIVTIRNNVATMLQRCVALKVVVANVLV